MTDRRLSAYLWAAGLVCSGILLLLFNFGFLQRFEPIAQILFATVLAAIGAGFFISYLSERTLWWRLIPGWTLLSVAAMALLSALPNVQIMLIPAVLFLGLAMAFGNIYLINRVDNWWAILPGGFMFVLGVVIGLNTAVDNLVLLFSFLLFGMGFVFLFLSWIGPTLVRWWPIAPGMVLSLFGLFVAVGGDRTQNNWLRWWPIALIVIGIGIGWRAAVHRQKPERLSINIAPGTSASSDSEVRSSARPIASEASRLGEYSGPAPGASVEVISDYDE